MAIIISENNTASNVNYIALTLGELFKGAKCEVNRKADSFRCELIVNCNDFYKDIVLSEICDKVAEIIAINYKYEYFKENINVCGLKSDEKEILFASLIAADLEDDKRYCYEKCKNQPVLAIDGLYNFRLNPLKRKWEEVVNCLPASFTGNELKDFISYLTEHKKKKIYVSEGLVFDSHYRRLNRCDLLGGDTLRVLREVLLSNCGEIELSGRIPKSDEYYLKEYYADRITFSPNYYT